MALPSDYYETRFLLESPPFPEPFAIITAWNPMDEPLPLEANQLRDTELRAFLTSLDITHFRATGCSPDRSHSEPGWAAILGFETACELSRYFDQRAFWWIERDELSLVPSDTAQRESLGSFARRLITD